MTQFTSAATILKGLNPEQKLAVETTEGPLLILAGAGSGKTSVMTRRIAYLMNERGVAPFNILAITFTNKAAKEMNERIQKLVGEAAEDLWMSTFHSMCVRILRREAERIGFKNSFTILDPDDQVSAIKQAMLDLNLDIKKFDPNQIQWRISAAKNELQTPDDFVAVAGKRLQDIAASQVYRVYQRKLQDCNAMDFDDLIMKTVELFETQPDATCTSMNTKTPTAPSTSSSNCSRPNTATSASSGTATKRSTRGAGRTSRTS
jgi:DNA helicase-2/ATP-dependent DNA helicase PcrA